MWFVKSKRASTIDDYETWIAGGVATTLNVMDNTGDSRATVLILFEPKSAFEENWGESKVKNALRAGASKSSHIIFYGNRVDDIRIQSDVINTLQARMGTGGGNMPIAAYSIREDAKANTFSATPTDTALAVQALVPSVQSHHAQIFLAEDTMVRRLTPVECERLQGFPDNWTEGQADTHRYKQMGNAVAVPVVSWLVNRLMEAASDLD